MCFSYSEIFRMISLTAEDILNFLITQVDSEKQCEFLMEVTDKTMADFKVGTSAKELDGYFIIISSK